MSHSIFRLIIVVAVLTFAAVPSLAQQINGEVRIAGSNTPLFNVQVECAGTNCSGYRYTDRRGRFTWTFGGGAGGWSGGTGNYTITIRHPGFLPESRSVTLMDVNQTEHMFFSLKPDPKASGGLPSAPPAITDARVPEPARKEYQVALDEVNNGKPEKAIPHLEKAIGLYPNFLEAQLLLGTSHMDAKQWDKAEAALRRAVEIDPKRTEGLLLLGELYYHQKKYAEAEKPLVLALQLKDDLWSGHYTLALVYVEAKAFDKAALHIEKANKLRPDYAEGHFWAGNIYLKTNNGEGALKEFEEYLRLDPKSKRAPQVQNTVAKLKEVLKK